MVHRNSQTGVQFWIGGVSQKKWSVTSPIAWQKFYEWVLTDRNHSGNRLLNWNVKSVFFSIQWQKLRPWHLPTFFKISLWFYFFVIGLDLNNSSGYSSSTRPELGEGIRKKVSWRIDAWQDYETTSSDLKWRVTLSRVKSSGSKSEGTSFLSHFPLWIILYDADNDTLRYSPGSVTVFLRIIQRDSAYHSSIKYSNRTHLLFMKWTFGCKKIF